MTSLSKQKTFKGPKERTTKVNRIGTSSNGDSLYKVVHRPTGNVYALRTHNQVTGCGPHSRSRIHKDYELLRGLDNPNIVKCYQVFDVDDEVHAVIEYMDEGSLKDVHIPLESSLANITKQVLSALCYLHSSRYAYRDVRPENFLINSKGDVKLAEFGMFMFSSGTLSPASIGYYSPERISSDMYSPVYMYDGFSGDIWSLGLSVLELYLGKYPFEVGLETGFAGVVRAIHEEQPPEAPLSPSKEFRDFIACCLQKDSSRRWTAEQLLQANFVKEKNIDVYLLDGNKY